MRKKTARFLVITGILTLLGGISILSGCIPYPHTAVWSPEIKGRVLDSSTRSPVQGAKVFFMQSPQNVTYTDATGEFRLRATRKSYLGSAPAEGDWPHQEKGPNYAQISCKDYYPFWLFDNNGTKSSDSNGGDIGDILLNSINSKSDLCEIHHAQMIKKTVALYYKNYPMDQRSLALYQASTNLFPHAEESDIPSFWLAQPDGADIYICPECQKVRHQWLSKYDTTH